MSNLHSSRARHLIVGALLVSARVRCHCCACRAAGPLQPVGWCFQH